MMKRPAITKLSARHHQAIDLRLQGFTHQEIADRIGVKRPTVSGWFATQIVADELDRIRSTALDEARQILTAGTVQAARTLVAATRPKAKVSATAVRAAMAILDRSGIMSDTTQAEEPITMDQVREILASIPRPVLDALLTTTEDENANQA